MIWLLLASCGSNLQATHASPLAVGSVGHLEVTTPEGEVVAATGGSSKDPETIEVLGVRDGMLEIRANRAGQAIVSVQTEQGTASVGLDALDAAVAKVGATCDPLEYEGRVLGIPAGQEVELKWTFESVDGQELHGVGDLKSDAIVPVRRTAPDTWVYVAKKAGEVRVGEKNLLIAVDPADIDGLKTEVDDGTLVVTPKVGAARVPCAGGEVVEVEGCDATPTEGGWTVKTPCTARIVAGGHTERVPLE